MEQLEVIATDIDGVRIIAPAGEIDLSTAPTLQKHLRAQLDDSPGVVVIRLDLVSFIDSCGVRALVATYHQARAGRTELCLAAASDPVQKVLNLTKVDKLIPTYVTLREARRAKPATRPLTPVPRVHDDLEPVPARSAVRYA